MEVSNCPQYVLHSFLKYVTWLQFFPSEWDKRCQVPTTIIFPKNGMTSSTRLKKKRNRRRRIPRHVALILRQASRGVHSSSPLAISTSELWKGRLPLVDGEVDDANRRWSVCEHLDELREAPASKLDLSQARADTFRDFVRWGFI